MTAEYVAFARQTIARGKVDVTAIGRRVLEQEADALRATSAALDGDFTAAVWRMAETTGRVVVTGVGKSVLVGRKIAATLASVGRSAFFVHANEASHGDIGMIGPGDVLLALSNSGDTPELSDIVSHCVSHGIDIIALVGKRDSALGRAANLVVAYPRVAEACTTGLVPTTSSTVMLALGDALAVGVMEVLGTTPDDFQRYHPGGRLGARLTKVDKMMRSGESLPIVGTHLPMQDVVIEMSAKAMGIALVVNGFNDLEGVITDGDMRRNIHRLWTSTASDIAQRQPRTVSVDLRVVEALAIMTDARITALPVLDADDRLVGLLHMMDCLRMGYVSG